ncbi:MAG: hypothetical protein PHT33_02510 [bacterium]|nr:hypothetical protein [bacterium]
MTTRYYLTARVVDAAGKPVPGTVISVVPENGGNGIGRDESSAAAAIPGLRRNTKEMPTGAFPVPMLCRLSRIISI